MPENSDSFNFFKPFQDLSQEALQILDQAAGKELFQDGEIIHLESENVNKVYFVRKGNIRTYRSNVSGREQNLTILNPGDILNLPVAFLKKPVSRANAAALGRVEVLFIPIKEFRSLASRNAEIALRVFEILSSKISDLTDLSYDLSLRSVRGRLALFLLNNAGSDAKTWTQAEIASQIGTVREVVSRTIRSFVKEGIIRLERQQIVIEDPEKLKQESIE